MVFEAGIDEEEATKLLPDPQTNGGLLIAIAPNALQEVQAVLKELGIQYTEPIAPAVQQWIKEFISIRTKNKGRIVWYLKIIDQSYMITPENKIRLLSAYYIAANYSKIKCPLFLI